MSTPATLRYAQGVILIVALMLGLVAAPLIASSEAFTRQSTAEKAYADLSTIQTQVARANEIAFTSMFATSPTTTQFQKQMATVAQAVADAGRSGVADTKLLGAVNAGLIQYTAKVNSALTAEAVEQGSGAEDMRSAQQTLKDTVWTNLTDMMNDAASDDPSATLALGLAWAAIIVAALAVVWMSIIVARRSRRVLNVGLGAAVLVLVAAGIALGTLGPATDGPTQATTAHALTAVEGQLAQARGGELTYIIAPTEATKAAVDSHLQEARQQLSSEARGGEIIADYSKDWKTVQTQVASKQHAAAVKTATTESGPALAQAQSQISGLIKTDQEDVEVTLSSGASALRWLGIGMLIAALGYLVFGVVGLQTRIREYR